MNNSSDELKPEPFIVKAFKKMEAFLIWLAPLMDSLLSLKKMMLLLGGFYIGFAYTTKPALAIPAFIFVLLAFKTWDFSQKIWKRFFPLVFLFPVALQAQLPTTDVAAQAAIQQSNAQRIVEHAENISKWTDSLQKAQEQLQKANEAVELLNTAKEVAGDPSKIGSLLGSKILGNSSTSTLGKTFSEIGKTAGQASDLASSTQGVFGSPINTAKWEDLKSGNVDFSKYDPNAPLNSIESAFQNFSDVMQKSESDAKDIQEEIDRISKLTPANEAEQRQKQADLTALQAKLADVEKRKTDAFQKLEASKTLYETQKAKQGNQTSKIWQEGEKEKSTMYEKIRKLDLKK